MAESDVFRERFAVLPLHEHPGDLVLRANFIFFVIIPFNGNLLFLEVECRDCANVRDFTIRFLKPLLYFVSQLEVILLVGVDVEFLAVISRAPFSRTGKQEEAELVAT